MSENWIHKNGYSTQILATQKQLNQDNIEIQRVTFYKGKYSHYHKKKTEFFYFLSGEGFAIVEGKQIEIKSGVCIIIPPNVHHSFENMSDVAIEAIMTKTNNDTNDTYTQ